MSSPQSIFKAAVGTCVLLTMMACATGGTPQSKKDHARAEAQSVLAEIYKEHPAAKKDVASSLAHVVCTGTNNYLLAISSGGGICVLYEKSGPSYWRFATAGAGAGLGIKKVGFVHAFTTASALRNFKDAGFDGQAQAEASAKYEGSGEQVAANQSVDLTGVKTYQVNLAGAAAQATVQGYKYWRTNFEDDVVENSQ